ncbi:ABC-type transporter Mla maintaining outer membrane lipid asymmetry, component MlaD [Rubritalea squalenifaciens DSM 18772]|uniref:ABC-type transporter Mla maintaining outer membrane lipid asymmetry, component MlaD n=3 Tax=Rubritaleaceae TaxID=1648490 RepID=A0A1M6E0G8_9BACT|nr:ABC-type transporter Mla maintaining outer membrane lipid asymmetry, component MlaD [Rubritalea squalenifaciens DSM 18772]
MGLKEKRSETLVGLFVLVGLLALGGLILQFGKFSDKFKGEYTLFVEFKDASGLIEGSEVRMGGARVGKVINKPRLTDDLTVMVELSVDERVKLYKGSEFLIQSVTLLGDKMVVVVPPEIKSEQYYADGDFIMGGGAGGLDALQSDAESVARDARGLMKDARTSLLKVDAALDDIRAVAGRLSETLEKVNSEILDDQNTNNLRETFANLEQTSAKFKNASEQLDPVMQDLRGAITSVKNAADSADKTFASANEQIKKLEPALAEVPVAVSSLSDTAKKAGAFLDQASSTVGKLEEGDGLLGAITTDEEVGTDAKTFIKNLKRYGILGYKDDETKDDSDARKSRYRGPRR